MVKQYLVWDGVNVRRIRDCILPDSLHGTRSIGHTLSLKGMFLMVIEFAAIRLITIPATNAFIMMES